MTSTVDGKYQWEIPMVTTARKMDKNIGTLKKDQLENNLHCVG